MLENHTCSFPAFSKPFGFLQQRQQPILTTIMNSMIISLLVAALCYTAVSAGPYLPYRYGLGGVSSYYYSGVLHGAAPVAPVAPVSPCSRRRTSCC
ncbi:uncharacterized protein TNCV_3746921 [Trichonephila clavipes]|nr:uncharacterized protein TNCV_3746921 [Trichonephila clavipes]